MIPLLLLQVSMFQAYVTEAGYRLKVANPSVQVHTITKYDPTLLAWVWNCRNPADWGCGDPVVYIADDVVNAPIGVIRYLSYHEVCHLKLGHHTTPLTGKPHSHDEEFHDAVRDCMREVLGAGPAWSLEGQFNLYAQTIMLLRRQRFRAP